MVKNIITAAVVALIVVAAYHYFGRGVLDGFTAKKPALPAKV